jgi:3-hydroxyacyl-CoA dehydrogenase
LQTQIHVLIADVAGAHIGNADIIIEAVAERLEVKQAVFKEVEKAAKPGAILATNTSSIMIEDIAASLNQPERLIGLAFFQSSTRSAACRSHFWGRNQIAMFWRVQCALQVS